MFKQQPLLNTKVLIYDIETTPNLAYVWGKYQQDVIAYDSEWHMLCFAYKWLGEKNVHVVALPDFKRYTKDPNNDIDVIKRLHELFNEADVVIAHNGDSFDQKKSNARFITHGLTPPNPYRQIDTLKVARKYFKFNSNKLDDLGEMLQVGKKMKTGGFDLWLGCMKGDPRAWSRMKMYNKQDVILLEKIYHKVLPWIDSHPAVNLMEDNMDMCPKCGGGPLVSRGKYKFAKLTKTERYQCENCGGWSLGRRPQAVPEHVTYIN